MPIVHADILHPSAGRRTKGDNVPLPRDNCYLIDPTYAAMLTILNSSSSNLSTSSQMYLPPLCSSDAQVMEAALTSSARQLSYE